MTPHLVEGRATPGKMVTGIGCTDILCYLILTQIILYGFAGVQYNLGSHGGGG